MKSKEKRWKTGDLRVWWIPQIPMTPFIVPVSSPTEGRKILDVLAEYDRFQFEKKVKPDYSNTGGLSVFDESDKTDSPRGSWSDWYDDDGDDIDAYEFNSNGLLVKTE